MRVFAQILALPGRRNTILQVNALRRRHTAYLSWFVYLLYEDGLRDISEIWGRADDDDHAYHASRPGISRKNRLMLTPPFSVPLPLFQLPRQLAITPNTAIIIETFFRFVIRTASRHFDAATAGRATTQHRLPRAGASPMMSLPWVSVAAHYFRHDGYARYDRASFFECRSGYISKHWFIHETLDIEVWLRAGKYGWCKRAVKSTNFSLLLSTLYSYSRPDFGLF